MEAVVIGAFLNSFLPKLWEVIAQEHGLRFEIERNIGSIEEELSFVDACIRKNILHCISPSLELSQLINKARRLAEDTEQCISSFLLPTRSRQPRKMSHLQFAQQINDLRGKLEKIREEFSRLKQGPTIIPEEPEDRHSGQGRFVGMVVRRQELRELLDPTLPEEPNTKTRKLKVISIVGFGGSGKTRLAQEVRKEAQKEFDPQACVHMGLKRNVNEVLKEILEQLDNGAGASTDVKEGIKSRLGKKRYLIVIDDVRSTDAWGTLMEALPDSNVGSRIIVTTTSQPVAERCSYPSGQVYQMSTLCDQDSRDLFWSVLSGEISEATKEISEATKEKFIELIHKCDGLPLALIESAESFKAKTEVHKSEFEETVRNLCVQQEGSNGTLTRMQWVLMNKYSGLTSYGARACSLYFHMFPFDNPRKRKFLTRQWLAEGLVERDATNCSDLESASKHLKTLSDGNIIRSTEVSNNPTVKSCRLPGTMHQFISSQSLSQNFATFLQHGNRGPPEPRNVRRLSLHYGAAESGECIEGVHVHLLRTLAVSGKTCEAIMEFSKYEQLRVLDLKEWDHHQLTEKKLLGKLKDICKLVMLKYLGLPGSIGEVPREIADLIHLETLDLGRTEKETVKLPGEVIRMTRLKHILGRFRLSRKNSAKEYVPEDSRLVTVSGFVTNGDGTFPELMMHMKRLTKVKIWCDFEAREAELEHLKAAIKEFIRRGTTAPIGIDRSLSIDIAGCKVPFLEYLEAPGRLTKLKLHGSLKKVPGFIKLLTGLQKLCLSFTALCGKKRSLFAFLLKDDAEVLLPSLTYLKLVEDELGPIKILPKNFPSLERICLVGNRSLNGITIEAGALKFLFSLHIICKAPDGLADIEIGGLERLREIALGSEVNQTTKDTWKEAARVHPNKPRVLSIEPHTKH